MGTVRISEAELARDLHAVLAKVQQGIEVVVEQDHRPVAVIKPSQPAGRMISEIVSDLKARGSTAVKLLRQGGQAERKQLLRTLIGEVKLMPQDLEVSISYRLPEAIMNGLVAGVRSGTKILTLPFRLELVSAA